MKTDEMENSKFDIKQNSFLLILFIVITIFHIEFASLSQRAAYLDGAMIILKLMDNFQQNNFQIMADPGHVRYLTTLLAQLPMMFSYIALGIKSKYILSVMYSLGFFILPPIILWLNYNVAKKGQRIDIFVISFFMYGAITILSQIFSISELGISVALCFLLFTYLAGQIQYKYLDITIIIILLITMFSSHEYILFAGFALFIASLYYARQEINKRNRIIKNAIGIISLLASLYVFIFIMTHSSTQAESVNFLKEFYDYLPYILKLNTLISLVTIFITIVLIFYKHILTPKILVIISGLYFSIFIYMLSNLETSLQPMWELHTRSIPCWLTPLIILLITCLDYIKKRPSCLFYSNFFSIILICTITQTAWQITHTYWWNKNIGYMQKELNTCNEKLYLPIEHQEIASFFNPQLRRYIWYYSYAATSILFSPDYKIKTMLMHYDTDISDGGFSYRDYLYKLNDEIFIIPTTSLLIKNNYWDATEIVEALDKYNKNNTIPVRQ